MNYRRVETPRSRSLAGNAAKTTTTTLRTIALAVVVVAVAARPTVAAPQQQTDNDGSQVLTIGGQRCKCGPFYLCDESNTVYVPAGSTERGCTDGLVCCQLKNDNDMHMIDQISTSESPHFSTSTQYSTSTRDTYIDQQQQPTCTCVPTNQCSVNDEQSNEQPNFDVRVGNCKKNQVCCNSEQIIYQNIQEPDSGNNNNNNVRTCGVGLPSQRTTNVENLGTRILSSEENSKTYFGQYPWMIAILITEIDEQTGSRTENVFQCGGSLIHPQVVLTAAHCVRGLNKDVLKVRVGEWNTQSSENEEEKSISHQDIGISQIIIHPNFNNGSMFNDVALIKLYSAAILKEHINTICIPNNGEKLNYDSQSCVSTGWGKDAFDSSGRYQNILKKVDLSLVPNDQCQQRLRNTRLGNFFRLHESFICAGGIKGVDVCKGDGGGPLFCAVNGGRSAELKKYVQVGIVSWGIGCGEQSIPGVYSSVEANSQWINQQLKKIVY